MLQGLLTWTLGSVAREFPAADCVRCIADIYFVDGLLSADIEPTGKARHQVFMLCY